MSRPSASPIAYYAGARIGFLLTPSEQPVSTLWPPNAILLAAFCWRRRVAGRFSSPPSFRAHLAIELRAGVPMSMMLCWFVSNSIEALIGAFGVRSLSRSPIRLETFRRVSVFVACAALVGPFFSSFIDAAFVALNHFGSRGYWEVWRARFFSNTLATLALVPVIIALSRIGSRDSASGVGPARARGAAARRFAPRRVHVVFTMPMAIHAVPALLYAPLPFLLWAAVRFGPGGRERLSARVRGLIRLGSDSRSRAHSSDTRRRRTFSRSSCSSSSPTSRCSRSPLCFASASARQRRRDGASSSSISHSPRRHVSTWDWPIGTESERLPTIHRRRAFATDVPIVEAAISRALADSDAYEVEFRRGTRTFVGK